MVGNEFGDLHRMALIEVTVAVVDDRQPVDRIEAVGKGLQFGQLDGSRPHRLRALPGARAKGRREVERYPRDGDIDAGQVSRVLAAQERKSAGIGLFDTVADKLVGAKRIIVVSHQEYRDPPVFLDHRPSMIGPVMPDASPRCIPAVNRVPGTVHILFRGPAGKADTTVKRPWEEV